MTQRALVPFRGGRGGVPAAIDSAEVPHWTIAQVRALMDAARERARSPHKGERDALLARLLFDGCLRVSEALSVTPDDFEERAEGWFVHVIDQKHGERGPRGRTRRAAVTASTVAAIQAYAYRRGVQPDDRVFPISRKTAWELLDKAAKYAGIQKPPHVGAVHILRHTGAIERLRASGSPNGVQAQLGHSSMATTLRYLKTITLEDALAAQADVDVGL